MAANPTQIHAFVDADSKARPLECHTRVVFADEKAQR
jgi:hypothetical protein